MGISITPKGFYNTAQGREQSERTLGDYPHNSIPTPKGLNRRSVAFVEPR